MRPTFMSMSGLMIAATLIFVPALASAQAGSNPTLETETGQIDPLGCKILKSVDGAKRGFIYKKAGHWDGRAVAVTLKALRGKVLNKNMSVYSYTKADDGTLTYSASPVSTMRMKFDGVKKEGHENILLRPAFQEYGLKMTEMKRRYGSLALVARRKSNPGVCYTWLIPDPVKRYD